MNDVESDLVGELRRVKSDLGFRSWTRHRMAAIAFFVVLDIVASVIAITALVQVNAQRKQTNQQICQSQNRGRAGSRELWAQLIAQNPVSPLPANPTPAQIKTHDRLTHRADALLTLVNQKYAPLNCASLYK